MKITDTFSLAEPSEAAQVAELIRRFWVESPYAEDLSFSVPKVQKQVEYMSLDRNNYLIGISVAEEKIVGTIIGQKVQPVFGTEYVGIELAWYLLPEHRSGLRGKELVDAFEQWAVLTGCKVAQLSMLSTSPEIVESLYYRRGYAKTEMGFQRRIN